MLPRDSTELPFKTLVRHSDGEEDPWSELPNAAVPEPESGAAITVAPALAAATTGAPDSAPADPTAGVPAVGTDTSPPLEPDPAAAEVSMSSTRLVTAVAVVVVGALVAVMWVGRRAAGQGS